MPVSDDNLVVQIGEHVQAALHRAFAANPGGARLAAQNAAKALDRIAKRAEPLSGEYERVELVCSKGRTIEFSGRLLAETRFDARSGASIVLELWETPAGAWIAATSSEQDGRRGGSSATVIPPSEDREAREDAAMEQWDWHQYARSMARKALGWSLRKDVA